ncbi:MAG: 1-acyl-sn-glycerol-3-phosphate acyltransferase [Chloroflexi bacterium]|nr:MAG: 1-acyl-sn-glycerol-3-phosphate acyltransferase [Chloroflexota bacterium]
MRLIAASLRPARHPGKWCTCMRSGSRIRHPPPRATRRPQRISIWTALRSLSCRLPAPRWHRGPQPAWATTRSSFRSTSRASGSTSPSGRTRSSRSRWLPSTRRLTAPPRRPRSTAGFTRELAWYSEGLLTRFIDVAEGVARDVERVRRGWHWDTPRPRTWPEQGAVVPAAPTDLGWARVEPVRSIRYLIQRVLLLPFTEAMVHPKIEGREWVRELERPVIFAANHSSHADTSLILHSLTDTARDRTVVAAAADYWFKHPILGNIVSLFLNTFPFSRTGGAQAQLHSSSQLLKSGWNLVLFPEGSRSPDGRIQEFKPGVGHLAKETGTPVVPMHIRGAYEVMPRGQKLPLPGPVRVRIGKPMTVQAAEGSREFTARVEKAVRNLAAETRQPDIQGTWVERWKASEPRELRYESDN